MSRVEERGGVRLAVPEGKGKGPCSPSPRLALVPPAPGGGSAAGGQDSHPRKASLSGRPLLVPQKEGSRLSGQKNKWGEGWSVEWGPAGDNDSTECPPPLVPLGSLLSGRKAADALVLTGGVESSRGIFTLKEKSGESNA